MGSTNCRAVFLDRDGVLIEDRPSYVRTWGDVEILPASIEACRMLSAAGFTLVVVTNQAVVGRGSLPLHDAQVINQRILDAFAEDGVRIEAAYMCPHSPEDGCDCRKPKPGMLLSAARDLEIDLSVSYLVGDAIRDVQAAAAAGVTGILVRTGRGREEEALLARAGVMVFGVYDDLAIASEAIIRRETSRAVIAT